MLMPSKPLNIFFTSKNSLSPLAIARPTNIENVITPKIFPSVIALNGLTKIPLRNCLINTGSEIEDE